MSFFEVPPKILSFDPTIVGSKDLFIAETAEDAAAAIAAGFPALAFTNNFRTDDNYIILIDNCTKSERVYILNTSGDTKRLSEAGYKLASQWVPVFVVNVYDDAAAQFKTLPDYLQTHTPADFKALVQQAPSFIDILISQLPANFPHAVSPLKEKILPLIVKLDSATLKHYADGIRKRTKTTVKVIEAMLAELRREQAASDKTEDESGEADEETDPEILAAAAELALKPQLLKLCIDAVNASGVSGERRNIAIIECTINSRLLTDHDTEGQNTLGCILQGHPGAGKSYTALRTVNMHPESAIVSMTSASQRSLYYIEAIAYKCLVFMEAGSLANDGGDSELALAVRSLLSEGRLKRSVTERDEQTGKFTMREVVLDGPASFLTTSNKYTIEPQFGDRLFKIHPDESPAQTKRIIANRAAQKAGTTKKMDPREIRKWKAFHQRLMPMSVTIPYAEKLSASLNDRTDKLPIEARRAFGKIINMVQSVACLYQFQRERDASGDVIATKADYFMALQIVAEAFRENMGGLPKATNERLAYLASQGHKSPKDLSAQFGISRPALSEWSKKLEVDGFVEWVDVNGNSFADDKAMNVAKRSGKAHLQAIAQTSNPWGNIGLPMPSDIDPDPAWVVGGAEYEKYHLHLTPDAPKVAILPPAPPSITAPVPIAAVPSSIPAKSAHSFSPFGKKPATAPANTTPIPSVEALTAITSEPPARANLFSFSPDGVITAAQTVSAEDQAYWDGIAALTEPSPK